MIICSRWRERRCRCRGTYSARNDVPWVSLGSDSHTGTSKYKAPPTRNERQNIETVPEREDSSMEYRPLPATMLAIDGRCRYLMGPVSWEGFYNARDLGEMPTTGKRTTLHGALVRSADLRFVTERGWKQAVNDGFRTVVDLRRGKERAQAPTVVSPSEIVTFHIDLDDVPTPATAAGFCWYLVHRGASCAEAVAAVARAAPGGVIVHCGAGRDRTGLIVALALLLVGVTPEAVAHDYAMSREALVPFFARAGIASGGNERTMSDDVRVAIDVMCTLAAAGLERRLMESGLTRTDVTALRKRLTGSGSNPKASEQL